MGYRLKGRRARGPHSQNFFCISGPSRSILSAITKSLVSRSFRPEPGDAALSRRGSDCGFLARRQAKRVSFGEEGFDDCGFFSVFGWELLCFLVEVLCIFLGGLLPSFEFGSCAGSFF
jgi:hypothetical protein